MELIEGPVQPPGRIVEFIGPGFIPGTDHMVWGSALIATSDTFGSVAARNLAASYHPHHPHRSEP